ncbi:YcgN family cysteine cluster protein [Desulfonema ishimotonii]|uniref:YcgN family cysteine cluster protein n=1 Tax=Desulfonema ishimotonii TaxID=45657 RepID=A0A401FUH3_9BACT|nr:YcgN family cysteine cluster protein [Desulfonema ishimotonii]GBC60616.1 YcgN family cysteine cluster protein [Desulfonema ishimotonii]
MTTERNHRAGETPFWKQKSFEEMTTAEWESLCDGCARCCLHKLEDADTGEICYTGVACRLLDIEECRCISYENRTELMPDCLRLTPEWAREFRWLPATCAYRLIAEGRDLRWWHPLVSGDPATVHEAGISVREKAVSEHYINIDDLEAYILPDVNF